jgi:hypothetical protein
MAKLEGLDGCSPQGNNPLSDGVRDYNHFGHDFHRAAHGMATKSLPIGNGGQRRFARVAPPKGFTWKS